MSRAGLLDVALTLYISKHGNGFFSMSETWNQSEAEKWGVYGDWNYMTATSKLKTLIKSLNKSHAQYYY